MKTQRCLACSLRETDDRILIPQGAGVFLCISCLIKLPCVRCQNCGGITITKNMHTDKGGHIRCGDCCRHGNPTKILEPGARDLFFTKLIKAVPTWKPALVKLTAYVCPNCDAQTLLQQKEPLTFVCCNCGVVSHKCHVCSKFCQDDWVHAQIAEPNPIVAGGVPFKKSVFACISCIEACCYSCEEAQIYPLIKFESHSYCIWCFKSNFKECVACAKTFKTSDTLPLAQISQEETTTARVKTICRPCAANKKWMECAFCHFWKPQDGAPLCFGCAQKTQRCAFKEDCILVLKPKRFCATHTPIKEHHEKVEQYIQGFADANKRLSSTVRGLFLGIELEVELANATDSREEVAAEVLRILEGVAFIKHDGSLNNGFEIVSAPGTLAWHQKAWDAFFSWHIKNRRLLSHDALNGSCGLHVHISRAPLSSNYGSSLRIGKMINFIHDPTNYKFIRAMAGRPSSEYADYTSPKLLGQGYQLRSDTIHRYTAVNLRNKHTVEFRLFRGTLNRQTFLSRIEFCKALAEFTAPGVVGLHECNATQFVKFIQSGGRKTFPNLYQQLVDLEYFQAPKPRPETR